MDGAFTFERLESMGIVVVVGKHLRVIEAPGVDYWYAFLKVEDGRIGRAQCEV